MPKKKVVVYDATGKHHQEIEISQEQADREAAAKKEQAQAEVELTRAQQRLARLVTQPQATIEVLQIEAEVWFLKALNYVELTFVRLDMDNTEVFGEVCPRLTRVAGAAFYHGLAANAQEPNSRYFESLAEARDFVLTRDAAVRAQVDTIFERLAVINPDLIPKNG